MYTIHVLSNEEVNKNYYQFTITLSLLCLSLPLSVSLSLSLGKDNLLTIGHTGAGVRLSICSTHRPVVVMATFLRAAISCQWVSSNHLQRNGFFWFRFDNQCFAIVDFRRLVKFVHLNIGSNNSQFVHLLHYFLKNGQSSLL